MTVQGKIKVIKAEEVITDKFKKREIVIVTDETYPQEVPIQFTQDKCSLLDDLKVGQAVEVSINLRGKAYQPKDGGEERYFLSLDGWKIQQLGQPSVEVEAVQEQESDLPF